MRKLKKNRDYGKKSFSLNQNKFYKKSQKQAPGEKPENVW